MQIILRELNIRSIPLELEAKVTVANWDKESPDLLQLDPLFVTVKAWRGQELYYVQGYQETEAEFRCSRCLTSFPCSLTMEWFETFTDNKERARIAEEEEKEKEKEIHWVPTDQPTDLSPFIRESLFLHLPIASVCDEECKGLCPKCGTNQNDQPCQCDTRTVDPRLAKLEELLKREE